MRLRALAQGIDSNAPVASSSLNPQGVVEFQVAGVLRRLRAAFPRLDRVRRFLLTYLLPTSIAVQLLFLAALYISEPSLLEHESNGPTMFVLLAFQLMQWALIVFSSLRLVRQLNLVVVSPLFLVQAYLSTMLAFGGIHFLILGFQGLSSYRLNISISKEDRVAKAFGQCLYYSAVITSSTGYGDVAPLSAFARLATIGQMLTAQFFEVVILGLGLSTFLERRIAPVQNSDPNALNQPLLLSTNEHSDEVRLTLSNIDFTTLADPSAGVLDEHLEDSVGFQPASLIQ